MKKSKFTKSLIFVLLFFMSALEILTTIFNGRLITVLEKQSDLSIIIKFMAYFFVAIFLSIVLNYCFQIVVAKYIEKEKFNKKSKIINNLRMSDAKEFRNIDSSYIAMRLDGDMDAVLNFKFKQYYPSIFKIIKMAVMMGIVFYIDKYVFLFLLFGMPLMYFVYKASKEKITTTANEMMDTDAKYYSAFNSRVSNVVEIVQVGNYDNVDKNFDNIFRRAYDAYMKFMGLDAKFDSIINLLMFGIQIVIMVFAGYKVFNGDMYLGDMSNLFQFSTAILISVMMLTGLGKDYRKIMASENKLKTFDNIEKLDEGTKEISNVENLSYDITFGFDDNILYSNFEGELNNGNIYIINAQNGKGKTTLYKILTGVIKDDKAKIYVNGIDLKDINAIKFRKDLVDVVFQTPRTRISTPKEFFEQNVRVNNYEKLNKLLNESFKNTEVVNETIKSTYDKNFKDLSGGERQLIFILSSMLKNKNIQIYDEPTSNLDVKKKQWFMDEIKKIKNDRIILIISHDDDLKQIADKIIDF
ncbi:MAG: ABC transporter ATP-binding protein/permease [Ezakiella sp.]|nr:ABC transporter ATP-binding protein/permease [Ezakiella sp.]MDD7471473.1 ABC transporter ATP-binding protein [Bacillota bacterium]MDY3923675.1 ABC transporter ATP-binding protein [Ezakiella sp.]